VVGPMVALTSVLETGGSEQGLILRHTASEGCGSTACGQCGEAQIHVKPGAMTMRRIAPVIAWWPRSLCGVRQKAEIEAVNAKWIDFFNRVISRRRVASTRKTRPRSHGSGMGCQDYNRPALD